MAAFRILTDDIHEALLVDLACALSRTGRAAVLRQYGVGHDLELLSALDAAVAEPDPFLGVIDPNAISIALSDVGGVMTAGVAAGLADLNEREERFDLARLA